MILAERTPVLAAEVAPAEELLVLTRTAAVGAYDDGYVVLAQQDRLWHVRARRVILATRRRRADRSPSRATTGRA